MLYSYYVTADVFTALKMLMVIVWVVMPYGLVDEFHHFGRTLPPSGFQFLWSVGSHLQACMMSQHRRRSLTCMVIVNFWLSFFFFFFYLASVFLNSQSCVNCSITVLAHQQEEGSKWYRSSAWGVHILDFSWYVLWRERRLLSASYTERVDSR